MISKGAAAADSAMIIIDASPGNFESGFNKRGQTREHLIIIRALGCSKIIVAVNKMDSVQFNQDRFNQIKAEVGAFLASIGFSKVLFEFTPYQETGFRIPTVKLTIPGKSMGKAGYRTSVTFK